MYCVKCGVQLADSTKKCPLCQTDLSFFSNSEKESEEKNYSELYPHGRYGNLTIASIITVLSLIAITTILIVCINVNDCFSWAGYAIFGIILFYILFILPIWFFNPNYVIFCPISHLAIALFLLYVCYKTNGNWYLSFALPITILSCLLATTLFALLRYVKKGGYYIAASFFIALGLSFIYIEFFQHITFNTKMFVWSLYPANCFIFVGIFLLLAGIIKPLRKYLNKRFFI